MDSPRVSIITPVFNGERYLEETAQGVLGQTLSDWEWLLVDDGSTDASVAIAQRYAARYPGKVRCLEHPGRANHGQLASRIRGAASARAGVIALLDQDDVWEKDYLEKHLAVWDAAQPEGVFLSYGPSLYWFPGDSGSPGDYVQPMPPGAPKVFGPGELLESFFATRYANTPCPSCALLRREVFPQLRRFEQAAKGSFCEDQYLWWYVAARWPVAVHGNVWVRYRRHNASATAEFTNSAEATNRAELAFLRTVQDDLAKVSPDHPLLSGGRLGERIARLAAAGAPRKPTPRGRLRTLGATPGYALAVFRRRVLGPPRRLAGRVVNLLGALRSRVRLAVGIRPLSFFWGGDRGRPIFYHYVTQFLREFAADIRGDCLEFQEDAYTTAFGGRAVTNLDILHIDDSNPRATLIGDLTKPNTFPSNRFDCIICTHTLHVILELDKAVAELYRMLRPNGVLLVAVPLVSMCDPGWHELWRFTAEGLHQVLAKPFGAENVTVRAYGNSLTAAGQLRGLTADEFTRAELDSHDLRFAVEVCARAIKKGPLARRASEG
jgi:glycosyltransferase involved in cell wall biosynthesis